MAGVIKFSNIDTVIGTKGQSAIHAFTRDSQNRLIYERRILGRGDTINLTDNDNRELYNQYYQLSKSNYYSVVVPYWAGGKIQNSIYFTFIIHRGLTSLFHIFHMIFLYTKNIDLTLIHCKKALYYYIEFIGQIGDESHSYLQLNSKDAMLFIY